MRDIFWFPSWTTLTGTICYYCSGSHIGCVNTFRKIRHLVSPSVCTWIKPQKIQMFLKLHKKLCSWTFYCRICEWWGRVRFSSRLVFVTSQTSGNLCDTMSEDGDGMKDQLSFSLFRPFETQRVWREGIFSALRMTYDRGKL